MVDIIAQIEIRDEAREARNEAHHNFEHVFHRLSLMEASMTDGTQRHTSLERQRAALIAAVPAIGERINRLQARVAAPGTRAS